MTKTIDMAPFDIFVKAAIAAGDLRELRGQLIAHRDAIVAALDYLFLGV